MTARFLFLASLCLSCLGLTACGARSGEPVGTDTIDQTYTLAAGKFDTGSQIIVAAKARNFGGQLAICGARIESTIRTPIPGAEDTVLLASSIERNGETVLRDLRLFTLLPLEENMNGRISRCLTTGEPWREDATALTIRLPRYKDRSSRNRTVDFAPTDTPAVVGPPPTTAPDPEPAPKPGQWKVAK